VIAPYYYSTDRFCLVVSGTWWCNSGAGFDPAACVPVTTGSCARGRWNTALRRAHPWHPEPAIIAICGIGPVNFALDDPLGPRRGVSDSQPSAATLSPLPRDQAKKPFR
jgi:hypothetical protein